MKAILALALAAGAFCSTASADTYKWITYKPQGAGDAQAISTQWLVDQFSERTGGEHQIEVFWGGAVAKTREIPEALAAGVGDFGDIVTPYFPDQMPLNNAVGFFIPQPLDTQGVGDAMAKWHATYPQFAEELHAQGLHAIGFRPLENYGLLCVKPVRSMEDMKGLRVRSYGFAYPALIEAMGATPVSITTTDAYEALQRSVIDCTPIGPALARAWKYDEVAKYYIEVPFGASFGHLLAMNLDSYNGLDEKTRTVVAQLGEDYLAEYSRMIDEDTTRVQEIWKAELGVEVVKFPKGELEALVDDPKVQAVRAEWIEKAKAAGLPVDAILEKLTF
ncbi:C4-dicarboxylate TRAP transporter substrate-binding protein [Nitratireductor sp. ZSWI3]|uniref:C4-dicarboxylate TRAP transporter substrate-binding protein n=1 Tax=Nitratireductor sp. ZSWI3 TaxID=2966359 RepID=UPI00214FCF64|nr:C4-dicarboxylate TRAP transporter substrate-binding protein [Nitratireductor sp. ZSWI3]MCR4265173.1 C4-dicarboxylate TRAP transporter substrate-binding protein [Nitratireductor sp. ZSWI3]